MPETPIDKRILDHVVTDLPAQADLAHAAKDNLLIRTLEQAAAQGLTLHQDGPHTYSFKKGETKSDKH